MSETINEFSKGINPAIAYTWGKYREFGAASRKKKKQITNWRYRVLILGIIGAILGVLCQETIRLGLNESAFNWVPIVLGGLSGVSLGLAIYFGKELVNPEQEKGWVRCRSTAEALKAQTYLFSTGTPPFDQDNKDEQLVNETEKLLAQIDDLKHETLAEKDRIKGILPNKMSIEQYIKDRVEDQIDYYFPTSDKYAKKLNCYKKIGLMLGIIAIILGALGSTGWTAGWLAVISTLISSIAAFSYANKYQYLIISYQATGNRLEFLKTRWEISGKTDSDREERNKFIRDCEEVISIENSSWMAELAKKT